METIKTKIQELLTVSAINTMTDEIIKSGKFRDSFDKKMKRQEELMDELKKLARANNTILGRTIQIPHADSYALYLITKVEKGKATVKWLDWCDGWQDDILDYGADISVAKAYEFVKREDALEQLFSK